MRSRSVRENDRVVSVGEAGAAPKVLGDHFGGSVAISAGEVSLWGDDALARLLLSRLWYGFVKKSFLQTA